MLRMQLSYNVTFVDNAYIIQGDTQKVLTGQDATPGKVQEVIQAHIDEKMQDFKNKEVKRRGGQ